MSPSHLRCGVRAATVTVNVAGVALASVHLSGHHFADTFVVGAVIVLILIAGIWLMAEGMYLIVERTERNGDRIDRVEAQAQARHDDLAKRLVNAEAIAARAIRATVVRFEGEQDDAEVVGLTSHRRR